MLVIFIVFIGVLLDLVAVSLPALCGDDSSSDGGGAALVVTFIGDGTTAVTVGVGDRFAIEVIVKGGISLGAETAGTSKVRIVRRHLLVVLWVL